MKRFVSLILTLVMVLSMFAVVPMSASAQINLDASKVFIKADGKYYEVEKGQTYTYNYCLNVPNVKVSSLDVCINYDSAGLQFVPAVDEYGDDALDVMFPILKNVVWNYSKESVIYFNYSNISGVRLQKADSVIFTGEFLVTADSGVYEIGTQLKTLGDSNLNKLAHNGVVYGEFYESQAMPQLSPVEDVVEPTQIETDVPTEIETQKPTPTPIPTQIETAEPTEDVTVEPTQIETDVPTEIETQEPTPTQIPTQIETAEPTEDVTVEPTQIETDVPTEIETQKPTPTPIPTQIETAEPTEDVTVEPTQIETAVPTELASEEEEFVYVKADGLCYKLKEGDVFTYVYNLTCEPKIGSIDVHTYYDSRGLEFIPAVDEYGDYDLSAMFPVLKDVVCNLDLEDEILFNYSKLSGAQFPALENGQFTEKNRVFVGQFKVTASSGVYEISSRIKVLSDLDVNKIIFDYNVVDESAGAFAVAVIVGAIPEIPTEIKPTMKPEEPHKVYLVNSGNWLTPFAYAWNYIDGEMDMMWPGVEMKATGYKASNGAWVYEYTFNKVYDGIIFSNGGFAQTYDLEFMEDMYYDVVTQHWYSSPDVIPSISSDVYIVAGLDTLCGSNWDPSDEDNLMTYNEEKGVYEIVYENVAAGHYEFKVTTNYAWDNGDYNLEGDASFGGPNAVAKVEHDGSTVIIGFDGEKALLTIIAPLDHPTVPTEIEPTEPTQEPTEVETQKPTEVEPSVTETEDSTDDKHELGVRIGGTLYGVERGKIYKYVTYLTVPNAKIGSLDASVFYDSEAIDIMPCVDENGEYNLEVIFPVLNNNIVCNLDGIDGQVLFNHSSVTGKRFPKDDSVLVTFDFVVTAKSGIYDIYTQYTSLVDTNLKKYVMYGEVLDDSFTSIDRLEAASIPPCDIPATIYLINSEGWDAPYVYVWRDSDSYDEVTRWPGVKMQLIGHLGENEVYKYTFDKIYDKLIFNDCGVQQTADINFEYDMVYDNELGVWHDICSLDTMVEVEQPTEGETVAPSTTPTELPTIIPKPPTDDDTVTVYLVDSASWNGANVYLWTETEDGVDYVALWPGVKMELVGYKGDDVGVYSYTFDSKYDKIVFNYRENQGNELKVVPNGIYDNEIDNWIQLPVDPTEPVAPTEPLEPQPTQPVPPQDPKPGSPGGNYGDESPEDKREIGDINGDGKISIFDASHIQKYIAGYDGYTDFDEGDKLIADVNGDGKVNVFDASYIQKYIAGYFDSFK